MTTIYEYDPSDVVVRRLAPELKTLGDGMAPEAALKPRKTRASANVQVVADRDLTAPEKTDLDTALTDHKATCPLAEAKAKKILAIDNKTAVLVATFDHGGHTYDLDLDSQIGWTNIGLNPTVLTYPFEIADAGGTSRSFADADAIQAGYGSAVSRKESVSSAGRVLRDDVNAAVTVAAVDAIVDDRT